MRAAILAGNTFAPWVSLPGNCLCATVAFSQNGEYKTGQDPKIPPRCRRLLCCVFASLAAARAHLFVFRKMLFAAPEPKNLVVFNRNKPASAFAKAALSQSKRTTRSYSMRSPTAFTRMQRASPRYAMGMSSTSMTSTVSGLAPASIASTHARCFDSDIA